MAVIGELATLITARTAPFERSMRGVRGSVDSAKKRIAGMATGFIGMTAAVTGAASAVGLLTNSLRLAADAEQAEVAFTTLLGSAEKAQKLMGDIRAFAASTPFQLDELVDASRKLVAFGFSGDQVITTMRKLGDISAGTGNRISEIAELFGKARVQGRLMQEDINQLTGRGINVIPELAKVLGVAEGQLRSLTSKGKIGFAELETAITNMTAEGSQFGGMMEAQSNTAAGALSTLKDAFAAIQLEIGETITKQLGLTENIKGFTTFVSTAGERMQIIFLNVSGTVNMLIGEIFGLLGAFGELLVGMSEILPVSDSLTKSLREGAEFWRISQENLTNLGETQRARAILLAQDLATPATPTRPTEDIGRAGSEFGMAMFGPGTGVAEALAAAAAAAAEKGGAASVGGFGFSGMGFGGVGFGGAIGDAITKAIEKGELAKAKSPAFAGAAAKGSAEAARIIAGFRNDPQLKELEKHTAAAKETAEATREIADKFGDTTLLTPIPDFA